MTLQTEQNPELSGAGQQPDTTTQNGGSISGDTSIQDDQLEVRSQINQVVGALEESYKAGIYGQIKGYKGSDKFHDFLEEKYTELFKSVYGEDYGEGKGPSMSDTGIYDKLGNPENMQDLYERALDHHFKDRSPTLEEQLEYFKELLAEVEDIGAKIAEVKAHFDDLENVQATNNSADVANQITTKDLQGIVQNTSIAGIAVSKLGDDTAPVAYGNFPQGNHPASTIKAGISVVARESIEDIEQFLDKKVTLDSSEAGKEGYIYIDKDIIADAEFAAKLKDKQNPTTLREIEILMQHNSDNYATNVFAYALELELSSTNTVASGLPSLNAKFAQLGFENTKFVNFIAVDSALDEGQGQNASTLSEINGLTKLVDKYDDLKAILSSSPEYSGQDQWLNRLLTEEGTGGYEKSGALTGERDFSEGSAIMTTAVLENGTVITIASDISDLAEKQGVDVNALLAAEPNADDVRKAQIIREARQALEEIAKQEMQDELAKAGLL